MSTFERYLTLWVGLCIIAGITLGLAVPGVFQWIGAAEIAKVNLPVAALIWFMIIPMLVKIDFAALGRVKEHWRGIGVTLFINWAVELAQDGEHILLSVLDNGVGCPQDIKAGLGTRLVTVFAEQLGGRAGWQTAQPGGCLAVVRFPA